MEDRKLALQRILETKSRRLRQMGKGRAEAKKLVSWFYDQERAIQADFIEALADIGIEHYPRHEVQYDGPFPPPGTPVHIVFTFEDGEEIIIEDKLDKGSEGIY
jgi:phosphatidylethanolamine-binding protein (PEBP) family uncharacterized protein